MTSSKKVELEKFDGHGDYTLWKDKLLAQIDLQGLSKALAQSGKGARTRDPEEEEEKEEALDEIMKKARSLIVLSVTNRILRNIRKETTALGMIQALDKLYRTTDSSDLNSSESRRKYGLQIRAPSQKKQSSSRPPLRTASIFGEDEDQDVEKEISRQASKTKALKEIEEQHKKALEEDPSAFAYDEVYDDMKQKSTVPKMQDREERKPRYVQHLMKKAEQRKKEQEIGYERRLAKEREKDEHLFSGKERLVTGAYKRKLEERTKWLAEERLRELREERDDVTKKKDLSDFYFNIGKNVAFGARDIEAREAEKLEKQRKAEKLEEVRKEEKIADSPEKEVSPESKDVIGSSRKRSMEPQEEEQTASEKKIGSEPTEEKDSSPKEAAKEAPKATKQHKKSEDAIAAARERFLARKKTKIEE